MGRHIDPKNREIAIAVLAGSKSAVNWAKGELSIARTDINSINYKMQLDKLARQYAAKIIDERG